MKNKFASLTFKVPLGDLELYTAPDMGFMGMFSVTPKIHSHPYYEIIVALEGRLSIKLLDNQAVELDGGELCILPPKCYHSTCAEEGMPKMLAVRFGYGRISGEERIYDRFSSALESISEPTCFEASERLTAALLDLRREMQEKDESWFLACTSLLQRFYIEILRLISQKGGAEMQFSSSDSKYSRYYRIEMWFAENLANQITEDDLAAEISLSSRQLSRVFSDIYGMSFKEKLIEIRLHRAAQLLEQTELRVDEIAAAVGYGSPSGFHRAFNKYFGCTPFEYRKNTINGR